MGRRILVLVEGFDASEEALRYACAVARRTDGSLDLLLLLPLDLDPGRDREALQRRGERRIREWITGPDDPPVVRHVRTGDSWSEFCKFAATQREGYQLVVWASVGSRTDSGPGWPSGHWAGRVREELGCPVVLAQRRSGGAPGGVPPRR